MSGLISTLTPYLSSPFTSSGLKILHSYSLSQIAISTLDWFDKNVLVPSFQRYSSSQRVNEIILELIKRKEPTGIIILCKMKNKYYLVDGGHRKQAYQQLKIEPIPVQIMETQDEEEMFEVFSQINRMIPVEEYVLMARSAPDRKRKIEKLLIYLEENYKEYESKGSLDAFRFPNIKSHYVKRYIGKFPFVELATEENIVEEFEKFNLKCKEELSEEDVDQCERKKVKNGKYLYISKFLRQVIKDGLKEGDDRIISEDLRKQVWEKRNGDKINGVCFCCEKGVSFAKFECGHIVSWANGGKTVLENLEPVCKNCNVKMGKKHLLEYKKGLGK